MSRKQCKACPWRKDVIADRDIPGGYSRAKHCALISTISDGRFDPNPEATLRMFACHESPRGEERPCVGWMAHQLGPGNNIALRLAVAMGRIDGAVEAVGEQHECFEDTIPEVPTKADSPKAKRRGRG